MADVTITIDGNTTQLVTSAKKAENAIKAMGGAATQTGKDMERSGHAATSAWEKTAMAMGRAVIGARAVANSLSAARDKTIELTNSMVALGTQKGGFSLRGSRAAASGGLNQGAVTSFIDQISPASQEERVGFVESLSNADLGLSPQRLQEVLQAVSSGAFSPQEALEAAKNGDALNVQQRLQSLTPSALREIETRRAVDAADARSRGSFDGGAFRVAAAMQKSSDVANPGLASARAAVGAFDLTGLGGMGETVKAAQDAQAIYLKQIADSTSKTAADAKKLNTSGVTDNQ